MQVFGGETGKKTGKLTTTDQENAVIRCTQLKISDIGVVSSNLFTVLDLIGFMIQWLGLEMVTVEVKFRDGQDANERSVELRWLCDQSLETKRPFFFK